MIHIVSIRLTDLATHYEHREWVEKYFPTEAYAKLRFAVDSHDIICDYVFNNPAHETLFRLRWL